MYPRNVAAPQKFSVYQIQSICKKLYFIIFSRVQRSSSSFNDTKRFFLQYLYFKYSVNLLNLWKKLNFFHSQCHQVTTFKLNWCQILPVTVQQVLKYYFSNVFFFQTSISAYVFCYTSKKNYFTKKNGTELLLN